MLSGVAGTSVPRPRGGYGAFVRRVAVGAHTLGRSGCSGLPLSLYSV